MRVPIAACRFPNGDCAAKGRQDAFEILDYGANTLRFRSQAE
jgi:hypothetical protein